MNRLKTQTKRLLPKRRGLVLAFASSLLAMWNLDSRADSPEELAASAKEVLRTHCVECHGTETAQADVRVLDLEDLLESETVVAGKPDDSFLYQLITSTDSDAMPPTGRPSLTAAEIATIRKWITSGAAPFPADVETKPSAPPNKHQHAGEGPRAAAGPPEKERSKPPPTESSEVEKNLPALILHHVRRSEKSDREFLRFFSLRHLLDAGVTAERLETHRVAFTKAINHLSWEKELVIPQTLDADGTVLAVDIRKLGWHKKVLRSTSDDKRSLNLFDLVLLEYPYATIAPDSDDFDQLESELFGATKQVRPIPFVRTDWFCSVVLQPPLYHDLLQLPRTLEELESILNVDSQDNVSTNLAIRAGLTVSGVSRNNRIVERHPQRDGYYYASRDFASNLGSENILRDPIDFRASGGEMIFRLPNGMQGYYVADGQGRRLDAAPTSIVVDKFASDRVVRNGLGCIRCHRAGIKDFRDSVRDVVAALPGNPGFDRRKALELYPTRETWDDIIARDKRLFEKAMSNIASGSAQREPVSVVTSEYLEGTLSVQEAAAELGVSHDDLRASCRAPGFTRLGLAPLASGGVIRRDAWEDNFDAAVELLGTGIPMVAIDGNQRTEFVPNRKLDQIKLRTNKDNNFFEPGDQLRVFVENQTTDEVFIELYGTSVDGQRVRLTDGVRRLAAGGTFSFPDANDAFIEVRGGIGSEDITLFASTKEFEKGTIFRGKNIDDRVVHSFFSISEDGNRRLTNDILKKTIRIETR